MHHRLDFGTGETHRVKTSRYLTRLLGLPPPDCADKCSTQFVMGLDSAFHNIARPRSGERVAPARKEVALNFDRHSRRGITHIDNLNSHTSDARNIGKCHVTKLKVPQVAIRLK